MGKRIAWALVLFLVPLSVTMGAVWFQQIGSGMAGYWKCDDTAAPTTDSSGTVPPNNGAWNSTVTALTGAANTPAATSWSNGCLQFAATNAQVSVPGTAALTLTGDFTVSFWMYPDADGGDWQRLVGKGNATDRTFGVWRYPNADHRILFQQYNAGSGVINITTAATTPNTAWTHVAARISGNNATVFLNGSSTNGATGTRSGPPSAQTADPVTFAYAGFHTSFPGRLTDIRLYDRALSDADIAALAAGSQGPSAPTNLAASLATGQVSLTWTAPAGGAYVYNVKRSTVSGGPYTTIASNVSATSYTDTTFVNGTTYYYVVSGVTYGEGPNSNEVSGTPGLVVSSPTSLSVNERGGVTSFTVTIYGPALTGSFQVPITSPNPGQVQVSAGGASSSTVTLTFSAGGSTSQQVTVTGFDDSIAGDPQTVVLSVGPVQSSSDTNYPNGYAISSVSVSVLEADNPGILVSPVSGPVVDGGVPVTFSVTLNSKPAASVSPVTAGTVVLDVSNSAPQVCTVSPPQLSFDDTNWNLPQQVTITPLNDNGQNPGVFLAVKTVTVTLSLDPATSDPVYAAMTPAPVSAPFVDPYATPTLPKVWGGSGGGGCGLLGLEAGLLLLLLRPRRFR
jgi:hypothetical protein